MARGPCIITRNGAGVLRREALAQARARQVRTRDRLAQCERALADNARRNEEHRLERLKLEHEHAELCQRLTASELVHSPPQRGSS